MRRILLAGLVALTLTGCGALYTPPNLSPVGLRAWHESQITRALDTIRDVAQDGCDCAGGSQPVFREDVVRQVTTWHRDLVTTIHAGQAGWAPAALQAERVFRRRLPPDAERQLGMYFDVADALLKGAASR